MFLCRKSGSVAKWQRLVGECRGCSRADIVLVLLLSQFSIIFLSQAPAPFVSLTFLSSLVPLASCTACPVCGHPNYVHPAQCRVIPASRETNGAAVWAKITANRGPKGDSVRQTARPPVLPPSPRPPAPRDANSSPFSSAPYSPPAEPLDIHVPL